METIFNLKSELAELREIIDKLDEAANALAALAGHEESWPLKESAGQVARRSALTSAEP